MSLLASLTAGSPVFLASVAAIDATGRLRPVDEAHAQLIAASMNESGLIQPVVLRADASGNGLKLVVGGHRLRSAEILEWDEIPAILIEATDDEARQIEIDENLARRELTALERAEFLAERKRIYEALHPETAHGKAKKPKKDDAKGKVANFATFRRFSKEAAKAADVSESTVQQAIALFGKLAPEAVTLIRGSDLAKKQSHLKALAALDPADQVKVAREIAEGRARNLDSARVSAGMVPAGGVVRPEDEPLARLDALLGRMTPGQLEAAYRMIQSKLIAAKTPAAKAAKPKRGSAA
jgi:ParB family chromosome partitioning protein